jgi:hypothetical protein
MKASRHMDIVRTQQELHRLTGQPAEVAGRYYAVERPVKGIVRKPRPKDHALLLLEDGVRVYLEPFESPASQRPADELRQFEGKRVRVTGIAYERMPARGESPLSPCIAEITQIREEESGEDAGI